MNQPILAITQQEKENIIHIKLMLDKIHNALYNLPDHVKNHIRYEIEVFDKESEYMADMLHSII